MNKFDKEIEKIFGHEKYKKISAARVGIAGLGGLGSNCAFNLVRTGFKNFVLADYDTVCLSNINRQFYFQSQIGQKKTNALKTNLLKINPGLKIKLCHKRVTEKNINKLFENCDIVVEAFDSKRSKVLFCETFLNSGKFVVSASGIAGFGNLGKMKVKKIKNNFYIAGDFETCVSSKNPPLSARVNIAAAMQADIILERVINGGIS